MFKKMRIRYKLLIGYSIVFILSISMGSAFIYLLVRDTIKKNIESELNNTTNAILNMVQTSAAISIKNRLRAVAEKNLELVRYHYNQFRQGTLTQEQAQERVANLMLSQTIGESGYIYCIDSSGIVRVHPQSPLLNTDVSDHAFVKDQLKLKRGYIEYDWKNPGETKARSKALYMLYFAPWDWIISVSTYRSEFIHLVNVEDFRKGVLDLHSGPSGYAFVFDGQGTALIHPKLQGVNILETDDLPGQYLLEMHRRKTGKIIYPWKNPGEVSTRLKLVIFNHIPEYDWIVGSSSYLDEFNRPLKTIRNLILATVAATLMLVLPITFKISASITDPLHKLMHYFSQVGTSSFASRMQQRSHDEIGQLLGYFNRFMAKLERYHTDLTKEIEVRRKVEEELRESEERYRTVMEAAPDPIVVYDMKGRVTYLNPAFTRLFGWTLQQCLGKKMDHFVPDQEWDETARMITAVTSGETLTATQTCRYDKAGNIMHVSISGSTYRDSSGELAGSVIILRDITRSRRLQKQVMNIGDRERQKIGQDLHDDLCPHLIGIQGLSSVLEANLSETSSPDAYLAKQIEDLVGEAVEKTRSLTRGLCPVHMVSHGLETALQDLAEHTASVSGIACRFHCDGEVAFKDNTTATHLYYIAQEAVNNAVRHSGTQKVAISLSGKKEGIEMRISDEGKGIPVTVKKTGIGLQIMPYRAKMIGASFNIDSDPESGTMIQVLIKEDALIPEDQPEGRIV
ncbi:MAG: cache domain-containing protein [Desulfobacteraceae bacterium]|jgi:PAS domain S-box-containing protein